MCLTERGVVQAKGSERRLDATDSTISSISQAMPASHHCRLGSDGLDRIGLAFERQLDESQREAGCLSLDQTAR